MTLTQITNVFFREVMDNGTGTRTGTKTRSGLGYGDGNDPGNGDGNSPGKGPVMVTLGYLLLIATGNHLRRS